MILEKNDDNKMYEYLTHKIYWFLTYLFLIYYTE